MTQFQNKVAVITGGASGIGQALCEELARRGAAVVVADIDSQRAQQVASAIAGQGGRAESAEVDVADAKQMEKLVAQMVSRHGRLDYFFNNAAIGVVGELRDLAPEHWRRLVDVNLLGVVHGTMAAYTVMVRQGSGHIVNVASLAGLMPTPVMTPYSASKWAVVGFSTFAARGSSEPGRESKRGLPQSRAYELPGWDSVRERQQRGAFETVALALHNGAGGRRAGDSSRGCAKSGHHRLSLAWPVGVVVPAALPVVAGAAVAHDGPGMAHPALGPGITGLPRSAAVSRTSRSSLTMNICAVFTLRRLPGEFIELGMNDVTRLLSGIQQGEATAADELLPLVYAELRRLAAAKMSREKPGHTLQPTALVHEAWLRLVDADGQARFENRAHFFSAAAEAMRRILIERARRKLAARHGGGQERLDVDEIEIAAPVQNEDELLAINEALDKFATEDREKAELVKLRYFVGLTIEDAAEVLGISKATAKRWWIYARAWLHQEIKTG